MSSHTSRAIQTYKREGMTNLSRKSIGYLGYRFGLSSRQHIRQLQAENNLVVAEIGVWEGSHAQRLTRELDIDEIYLIDPYEEYDEYDEKKSDSLKMQNAYQKARKKLGDRQNINWIKKRSADAVADIDRKFDYVYIDGNHSYEFVKEDIENYYPLVKEGGILAGHDINIPDVTRAFMEFTIKNGIQPHIEPYYPDWYVVKE